MNKALLLLMFVVFNQHCCAKIAPLTLKELVAAADSGIKHPVPENDDEYAPSYEKFFKNKRPSWFRSIGIRFGLVSSSEFSLTDNAKELLLDLINDRELQGYSRDNVILFDARKGDTLILWGDIGGGLDSLIRSLVELERQGVIDNTLKIIKPDHYFLFNGNVVGRSAYSLDTLLLVARLMKENPGLVFYIRGLYEDDSYLFKFSVEEQLKSMGEYSSKDPYSLKNLLQRFIKTLPQAFYINYANGKDILRISSYGRDILDIDEQQMGSFFSNNKNKDFGVDQVSIYYINNLVPTSSPNVHVRTLIRGLSDETNEFVDTNGFVSVEPQGAAMTWVAFSAPTRFSRMINKFNYDAFVVLEFGDGLDKAVARLYNRDVRTHEPFRVEGEYFIRSGESVEPMASVDTKKSVNIGCTLDVSKRVATMGRAVRNGILLCLKNHNKYIGYKGRHVRVTIFDDAYTPQKARQNIDYLMQHENVDIMLLPIGTPTLQASVDLLKKGSILVLFPVAGAAQFRVLDMVGVVHWRPSYDSEVEAIISYLTKKHLSKKFVLFYQDDAYGQDPLIAARKVLQREGIKQWVEIPYNLNSTDFKDTIEKIKKAQPDALGLFATSSAAQEMLRQLGGEPLVGVQVFGTSFLVDSAFQQFATQVGFKYVFPRAVPNPKTSDLQIVKEYRAVVDSAGQSYDPYSLEAYIATSLLLHAISKVDGHPDHVNVRNYFTSLRNFEYKGLLLNYNKTLCDLSQSLWLDTGTDHWLQVNLSEEGTPIWNQ